MKREQKKRNVVTSGNQPHSDKTEVNDTSIDNQSGLLSEPTPDAAGVINTIANADLETKDSVKRSDIDEDVKELSATVIAIVGTKVMLKVKISDTESKHIAIPKPPHGTTKVLTNIPDVGSVIVTFDKIKEKPGRPVNLASTRQQDLGEKAKRRDALLAAGLSIGRGRPALPGSDRQERLAERADKLDMLKQQYITDTTKRIKDANPDITPAELKLHPELQPAFIDAKITLPKGRPAEPGSTRQEVLAKRALRIEANGGVVVLGRPSTKDNDITVAEAMELTPEDIAALEMVEA